MAKERQELDFLTKLRIRELILMGLITITAVLANLPQDYVEETLRTQVERDEAEDRKAGRGR